MRTCPVLKSIVMSCKHPLGGLFHGSWKEAVCSELTAYQWNTKICGWFAFVNMT